VHHNRPQIAQEFSAITGEKRVLSDGLDGELDIPIQIVGDSR
jgi:hypothetical protein